MPFSVITGLVVTIVIVGASLLGLSVARKWHGDDLQSQHEITDPYSQIVAMLFAVLIGFMVADAMQRFTVAKQTVQQEASSLGNVFRLSNGLPDSNCHKLRELCAQYASEVILDEWPMLAGKQDSMKAWSIYKDLWKQCTEYEPVTQRQSNSQNQLLEAMMSLGDSRRLRIEALHNGLPAVLWAVLIIGGIATIIFTYFFAARSMKVQIVMVGIVSLVVCLNLFLLATYDDPFSGDITVTPSAFETQLKLFKLEGYEGKITK